MARKTKVVFQGLNSVLERVKSVGRFERNIAVDIGEMVVAEMKAQIARGISPISGNGRFPEYLAVSRAKAIRKDAKASRNVAKKRLSDFGKGDKVADKFKAKAKTQTTESKAIEKAGYPYSVRGDWPDKRPRPVNLYLSGKQMKGLKSKVRSRGELYDIVIGYFDDISIAKEKGHREGAGGQPLRPTIPNYSKGERFSDVIQLKIDRAFQKMAKQALKTRKKAAKDE